MEAEKQTIKTMESFNKEDVIKKSAEYFDGDIMAAEVWVNKYALKNSEGDIFEQSPDDMHHRLSSEFARVESKYKNSLTEKEIYDVIKGFKYIIPQGSPMAGIGNEFQYTSVSNCFVIGNKNDSDSYGGILKLDQELVQLQKRRAGVGIDLTFIRPEGSPVKNSALTSTGVVPFMERYSNSTKEVAQDGRRGALMETISIKHPDAEKFIDAKMEDGKVTGANVSVKITDDFMNAVMNNTEYIQQYPVDSESPNFFKKIDAGKLWGKIIHNAWKSAEPGILFWDTVIKESVADSYADDGFKTISTNPCGEITLCASDSCRLLAINLYSYVDNPFTNKSKFNFDLFKKHTRIAMRLMDDLIDIEIEKVDKILEKIESDREDDEIKVVEKNLWEEIKKKAQMGRRTGLGITAEGDMIASLGLIYGTDDANDFVEEIHKTLKLEAYRESVNLAKERGAFEIWNAEKEKGNPFIERIKREDRTLFDEMERYGRRNISLLTIAPTGSVSICTQTTSGIEPVFMVSYKRRRKINPQENNAVVNFVDKEGNAWQEYRVYHKQFETWLSVNGYDVEEIKMLDDEQFNNIFKKSPYYKATSQDVDWVKKVEMQGKIQKHIDHSISVTINLPKEATEDVVDKLYKTAWESGCKGVTVYRDGSREGVLVSDKNRNDEKVSIAKENNAVKRPKVLDADVLRFQNNYEKWISFVGKLKDDDSGEEYPYELFTGKLDSFQLPNYVESGKIIKRKTEKGSIYDFSYLDKDGFEVIMKGLSRSFNKEYWNYAKLISGLLRHRMPISSLVNVVKSLSIDEDSLNTWKNGVIRTISKYIKNGSKSGNKCPYCGAELVYMEGCLKCESCGKYSKCG